MLAGAPRHIVLLVPHELGEKTLTILQNGILLRCVIVELFITALGEVILHEQAIDSRAETVPLRQRTFQIVGTLTGEEFFSLSHPFLVLGEPSRFQHSSVIRIVVADPGLVFEELDLARVVFRGGVFCKHQTPKLLIVDGWPINHRVPVAEGFVQFLAVLRLVEYGQIFGYVYFSLSFRVVFIK